MQIKSRQAHVPSFINEHSAACVLGDPGYLTLLSLRLRVQRGSTKKTLKTLTSPEPIRYMTETVVLDASSVRGTIRNMKILISGDSKGNLAALFKRVSAVDKSNGPFDMLFCVGCFFPDSGTENNERFTSASAHLCSCHCIQAASRPRRYGGKGGQH